MKTKILLIIFSILLLLPGCQTIKDKSDKIVQKENEKYGIPCERKFEIGESGTVLSFSTSGCI